MKKIISLVFAAILVMICASSLAEIDVKELPAIPARYADIVDPTNPLRTVFTGAYKVPVTVGEDASHFALAYLSKDYQQTQGFILIAPDSAMTAEQCLEEGGWQAVADANGLFLLFAEPGADAATLSATMKLTGARDYWMTLKGRNYLVAYGDTTDAMLTVAEKSTPGGGWAGVVTFGDLSVDASEIVNKNGTEMPVWMFVSEYDNEKNIVSLLKGFNGCTDEAFSNKYADEIYMPNQQVNDLLLNDQPMSQVRVTVTADAAALNAERAAVVYDFLKLGTREVGYGDKAMRYTHTLSDWGATVESVEIDGITRSWVQYVPTTLRETAEGKVPLMVALHGAALNGEYFAERTGFIRLAEEFGFVIVFPTGSIANAVSPSWNLYKKELEWDDVTFIKTVVDTVCKAQPIDTSRIYLYGHSMGGMTTQVMVSYLDGVFAAAAGTGCVTTAVPEIEHRYETPIFVIMGEFDLFGTQFESDEVQYFVDYFTKYNKASKEAISYRMGRFENYVFTNDTGAPMVRLTIADNMPHTATLDEGILIFEYLSQFSRGEDGSVVYSGGIYNAK